MEDLVRAGTPPAVDSTSVTTAPDSAATAQDSLSQLAFEAFTWTLHSIMEGGKTTRPLPDTRITLEMTNGKVSGSGGCNTYAGTYEATEDGVIRLAEIASTKRLCQGLMGQESQYLGHLQAVTSWKREKVELRLSTPSAILVFHNNILESK